MIVDELGNVKMNDRYRNRIAFCLENTKLMTVNECFAISDVDGAGLMRQSAAEMVDKTYRRLKHELSIIS